LCAGQSVLPKDFTVERVGSTKVNFERLLPDSSQTLNFTSYHVNSPITGSRSAVGILNTVQDGQTFRDGYHISDSIFLQSIHMHTNHQRNIFFRFRVFPSLSAFNAYLKRLTKCSEQNHEGYHRQVQARLICCEASVCTCNIFKACVTCGKYSVYYHHTSMSLNSIRTHKALRNKYWCARQPCNPKSVPMCLNFFTVSICTYHIYQTWLTCVTYLVYSHLT